MYLGRDVPARRINVKSAKGENLFDVSGKKYIDFSTNWCGILGWSLPEVQSARKNFLGPTYVDPNFSYEPWEELAKLLISIAPGKMGKVFRATGGTEAVEIALQAAILHTKRSKFISPEGYHGHSLAALSVGFSHYKDLFPHLWPCEKVKGQLDRKIGQKVANRINKGDIAAYISEPFIFNNGLVEPSKEYFQLVQESCKKYGTVFIIDEVATGFGRTGKMFASEYFDLFPDIVCLGKGLTGGNAVLGATLMNQKLAKTMEFEFSYYSTFAWQPLNVDITLAYLKYFLKNKQSILGKVNSLNLIINKRLLSMNLPSGSTIRSKGLATFIEFERDGLAKKIADKCLENGLVIEALNERVIDIFPPAIISNRNLNRGLDILEKSFISSIPFAGLM
ncbi:MAG: aspartate aminotransferase family protein [Patescibacteria group bacterium]|nr:aspartate aminotransferase family protein [Patescibacteria group bacterium]MCL5432243.1 aspartate aminotransferase family protein [Patescibacteria group bacterium]